MNINDFIDENGNIKIKHKQSNQSNNKEITKREYFKLYTNKLNKLISQSLIEMLDYTFLLNFAKSKGSIVDSRKFFRIMDKIRENDKISVEDKEELVDYCTNLFKYLYMIFEDKNIDISNLIKEIEEYNQNSFVFTNDQHSAIRNICSFMYNNDMRTFGLYGFAGTGKTTIITKLIHYLLYKNLIHSVAFTAPTNKAVNVLKSKFRSDLDDLIQKKFKENINNDENLDDILDKLEDKGFKVNFVTIHKLLNYKNDFDIEGERIFIKGDKASLENYDLVIVDETSMIPFDIIVHLFEEAHKKNIMSSKIPKILFVGDPAQLPPVHEISSSVFRPNEMDFKKYQNSFMKNKNRELDKDLIKIMEKQFNELKNNMNTMKYIIMKQVMRSNDNKVIGLCNEIRASVLNEIKVPHIAKYKGSKVFLYKYDPHVKKINTEWFKKSIEYFDSKDNKQHLSNIILTWTNKQSDDYNDTIRKTLFKKDKLDKFEIGDILILTDFYNMKETEVDDNKNKKGKRFYTSEQIKVTDIEKVLKAIPEFTENLPKKLKIKNTHDIEEKYIRCIKLINKNTKRKYNTWKLYVHKLADVIINTIPDTHQIYVVDDDSLETLKEDRKYAAERIKELRTYYRNMHKENLNTIDTNVIRPLWKELNKKLVDPFANVNTSFSITVHKSQGSSFYNVFIDMDDILKNQRIDEAKRCLYTACTRTSNNLILLI